MSDSLKCLFFCTEDKIKISSSHKSFRFAKWMRSSMVKKRGKGLHRWSSVVFKILYLWLGSGSQTYNTFVYFQSLKYREFSASLSIFPTNSTVQASKRQNLSTWGKYSGIANVSVFWYAIKRLIKRSQVMNDDAYVLWIVLKISIEF